MILPTQGRVLVEPIEPSTQEGAGGIQKVQKTNSVSEKGIIVEGSFDVRLGKNVPGETIGKGALIYFKKWAGEDIEHEGKKYKILEEREIIGYEN